MSFLKKIGGFMTIHRWFKIIFLMLIITNSIEIETNSAARCVWMNLQKRNKSFAHGDKKRRKKLACAGQNPCTIVLSCSDSRVPPELVFKKSIGDMFVVRVAGEVADDVVVDSIEYAVTHYDSVLIVVLGHSHCGAVIGAINRLKENNGQIIPQPGHIDAVLRPIEMAILGAGIDIYAYNAIQLSVQANIMYVANQLLYQSHAIHDALESRAISIVGAEYNLFSGKVCTLFTWDGLPD
jgi:carbonic anhydrase